MHIRFNVNMGNITNARRARRAQFANARAAHRHKPKKAHVLQEAIILSSDSEDGDDPPAIIIKLKEKTNIHNVGVSRSPSSYKSLC